MFAILVAAAMISAQSLAAQVPPAHRPAGTAVRKAGPSAAKPSAMQPTAPVAPVVPPPPPTPAWPINQQAEQPHITWDSHGLKIEASNSSLDAILHEVSVNTGLKVEGFGQDQRVFGTYGPGPAREVLSHLLDGTGYNVLMVGGQGDAPPSRLVLSKAAPSGPQPPSSAQNQPDENDIEADNPPVPEPEQPPPPQQPNMPPQGMPQPTPIRNPFGDTPRIPLPPMMQQQATPMPPDQQQQQAPNPQQ